MAGCSIASWAIITGLVYIHGLVGVGLSHLQALRPMPPLTLGVKGPLHGVKVECHSGNDYRQPSRGQPSHGQPSRGQPSALPFPSILCGTSRKGHSTLLLSWPFEC